MKPSSDNGHQVPYSVSIDTDRPLSFQNWKKTQARSVLYEQEYTLYNEYLIAWYQNKKNTKNDTLADIRLRYLILLKQIQIFFTREEIENWYSGIDINNEKELLLAIPYFSRKLKEIALYYQRLREEIKRTKLKYNLVGTEKSTIQRLKEILLTNFTKKQSFGSITIPNTVWKNIPELSAVTDTLNIQFEEMYDYRTYFDRTPNLPTSAYFNFSNELTEKYFLQKGLNLDNIDWIYRLGQFSLSGLFTDSVLSSALALSSALFEAGEQFLGTRRYSTFLVQSSAKKDFYTVNINQGNNFFYWPQGTYKTAIKDSVRYQPILLSESGLNDVATPGTNIQTADTIFIKSKTGVEGAWFYNKEFDIQDTVMEARIAANDKTIFRYPFPGFGLSSEDISWTGYGLVSDPRYFYLNDNIKRNIEQTYWNTSLETSSTNIVLLNDTTLIEAGAHPSKNYELADKIRIKQTPPLFNDSSSSSSETEAWLYKFENTDLPISTNSNTILQWPLRSVNPELVGRDVPPVPNNICTPLQLTDIDYSYSTASNALSTADVIYKINNFIDDESNALECAWLSGTDFYYPESNVKGINQASFCSIFIPGTFTRFVWSSTNQINVNNVFKGTENHLPDCQLINTPGSTYNDFELCTCRHVLFSPFGHPGDNFNDYPGLTDFIIEDTNFNEEFDINSWKDKTGTSFFQSSAVCWFKTNNTIGWGDGQWVANSSVFANNFYLVQGKRYIYYRAAIKNTRNTEKQLPEYVVRYKYPVEDIIKPVWIRGVKDPITKKWSSSGVPSDMTLYPGDFLIYTRQSTRYFNVTSTTTTTKETQSNNVISNDPNVNQGSIWSNYNFLTVNNSLQPIIVAYPIDTQRFPVTNLSTEYKKQIPLPFSQIRRLVAWKLTAPDNTIITYLDTPTFSFVPTITGEYSIALTAITGTAVDDEGYYYFTDVPKITAITPTTTITTLSTSFLPVPGFVLSTPLKGWNYSTNTRSDSNNSTDGGAPFWAVSYLEKSELNDYKGVEAWGGSVRLFDDYNIVTQPEYSNLSLSGGEYFEYIRNFPTELIWKQPLQLKNKVNKSVWCELKYETKTPQNYNIQIPDLITYPTTTPSSLLLRNFIENEPVEVFYNAVNSFTWLITASPEIEETTYSEPITATLLDNKEPWANLFNRNNPTVAYFPSFDTLSSVEERGNYLIPQNLGILTYTNKDYSVVSTLSTPNTLSIFTDPFKELDIRGFSKQTTEKVFQISQENNIWLKEPPTTGAQAGTIRNNIFKKYPKFLPYQSTSEVNTLNKTGLITPTSRQTPWGGKNNLEWSDTNNIPIDYKGEINVNAWSNDQILKINELYVNDWVTDIFGNQYGLYKNIVNIPSNLRLDLGGEIWTRKNSQIVEAGTTSLSSIFNQYKNIKLYNELINKQILKINTFFNTLYIETSSAILFEKIKYDFTHDKITSRVDSARQISLAVPCTNNLNREFNNNINDSVYGKPGNTWFIPTKKIVYIPVVEILPNNIILPNLYCLDIEKETLKHIFPIAQNDVESLNQLVSLKGMIVHRPVFSYNSFKKIFLYTFIVQNNTGKHIVELEIKNYSTTELKNIKVYSALKQEVTPPQIINTDLIATVNMEQIFTRQIYTDSTESVFTPVNMPRWATISNTGLLVCQPRTIRGALRQPYYMQFKVTNSAGPAFYTILINVI